VDGFNEGILQTVGSPNEKAANKDKSPHIACFATKNLRAVHRRYSKDIWQFLESKAESELTQLLRRRQTALVRELRRQRRCIQNSSIRMPASRTAVRPARQRFILDGREPDGILAIPRDHAVHRCNLRIVDAVERRGACRSSVVGHTSSSLLSIEPFAAFVAETSKRFGLSEPG